ncbi:hypothetical protein [Spongiivirga citrea]|uniref:Nuclear transport factor 2 family protein n=1 Tax=Spongiivirga citrea TaxID=1481457 RepID=A0A6M0CMZ9_9FLAO|nr:hypothetical protein [Spongiivirga citrea]NER17424.1 hypothetical protein [Spongiivirga citrea]
MKKITLFVCALFISVSALVAQSEDELKAQALTDAQASGEATMAWDVDGMMKYVHPNVFAMGGGEENIKKQMQSLKDMMKTNGVSIDNYKVDSVKDFVNEQGEYRCLVATTVNMSISGQKMKNASHLLGIYLEDKKHWSFIEASQLNGPLKAQLFPDFETKMVIPADVMTPQ